jgi:hypothetical protein
VKSWDAFALIKPDQSGFIEGIAAIAAPLPFFWRAAQPTPYSVAVHVLQLLNSLFGGYVNLIVERFVLKSSPVPKINIGFVLILACISEENNIQRLDVEFSS